MAVDFYPTLSNAVVTLRPLVAEDEAALQVLANEPGLWEYAPADLALPGNLKQYLDTAIQGREAGSIIVWTVIDAKTNAIAGTTRLAEIDFTNNRAHLGWTWIAAHTRGTGLNKAMKYEVLKYGFETLGLHRIELRADERNVRSRSAILGIGAKSEGFIREHVKNHDGFMRTSTYYSILKSEWPQVKSTLEEKLKNLS